MLIKTFMFLFVSIFFVSCSDNLGTDNTLRQAQNLVDQDPRKSLDLLNSITDPEAMKQDDYMQYVITLVQAKYETKQDISKDTIIYEAQRFFENTRNIKQKALSNFYGGWVAYKDIDLGQSILYFIQAEEYSLQIKDYNLASRSANNIGYLYLEQDVMDSAIVYYKKALSYCAKVDNSDAFNVNITTHLGRAYEFDREFDLAQKSFNEALDLAVKINNKPAQAGLKNNIGWIYYNKKEYAQAEKYLTEGLSQTKNLEDSLKIYLNLAAVYNATNQLIEAQKYCDLVQSKILDSSDKYVLRAAYLALSDYYKEAGNYEEAFRYSNLRTQVNQEIDKENQSLELQKSRLKLLLQKKQKELETTESLGGFYLSFVIGVLSLLGVLSVLYLRSNQRETDGSLKKEDKLQSIYRSKIQKLLQRQVLYVDAMAQLVDNESLSNEKDLLNNSQDSMPQVKGITSDRFLVWAKDYLRTKSPIGQIVDRLREEDILVLALLANRCTEKEIIFILDISAELLYLKKLELRNILEIRGVDDIVIDKLLLVDDISIRN